MDNLLELYCVVDDFLKDFLPKFEKKLLESGQKKSRKSCSMSLSEIMTIMIYFHQMRFRDFKSFYTQYLKQHLNKEFPNLLSYNRLVELMPTILIPRKRAVLESVNDQLKNISQIEHSRHRSINNFMVNLLSGIAAYALQPKKPSLKLCSKQLISC